MLPTHCNQIAIQNKMFAHHEIKFWAGQQTWGCLTTVIEILSYLEMGGGIDSLCQTPSPSLNLISAIVKRTKLESSDTFKNDKS